MGRLFWKFFAFILIGQLAAVFGTGMLFWLERQPFAQHEEPRPPPPGPPPGHGPGEHRPGGHPPPMRHDRFPVVPMAAGIIASIFCAAGVAWYFAKPIRRLRSGFDRAAEGDLGVRVAPDMGGRRDELADLGRDFDRMTVRLQGMVDGQKHLLHDVSHELRSPLARLQAAIGLARQQPDRMEDSLMRIEREGERMNQLVGELLTLSRLETGMAGRPEVVDLVELLDGMVEDARFEGAARQVTIEYLPGAPLQVMADPDLLYRALENVVRNALRHSPGSGTIRIELGMRDDGLCHVRIADQGPGIPESELASIFRPFYRGTGESTGSGYGLGLAIAQQVIAAVNGRISAKNGESGGLVVDIALPPASAA